MFVIYSFIDVIPNRSHNIPHEDTPCPFVPKITLEHLGPTELPLVPLTTSPCRLPPGPSPGCRSLTPVPRVLPEAPRLCRSWAQGASWVAWSSLFSAPSSQLPPLRPHPEHLFSEAGASRQGRTALHLSLGECRLYSRRRRSSNPFCI